MRAYHLAGIEFSQLVSPCDQEYFSACVIGLCQLFCTQDGPKKIGGFSFWGSHHFSRKLELLDTFQRALDSLVPRLTLIAQQAIDLRLFTDGGIPTHPKPSCSVGKPAVLEVDH